MRVPASARAALRERKLPFRDGLHAASHALLNVLPLRLMCGTLDMGTECDNPYDTRFRPERLLVFDKHPGGIGLAGQAHAAFGELLELALELVRGCDCAGAWGCPACVQHGGCGEYNAVLHKEAAVAILELTLAAQAEFRERVRLQQARPPCRLCPGSPTCLLAAAVQSTEGAWLPVLPGGACRLVSRTDRCLGMVLRCMQVSWIVVFVAKMPESSASQDQVCGSSRSCQGLIMFTCLAGSQLPAITGTSRAGGERHALADF